jgi:protein-tyrosine phosphatase
MRFRQVNLQGLAEGSLFLSSMPGRYEALEDAWHEVDTLRVRVMVCLAPAFEIEAKSPEYAAAIEGNEVPCHLRRFPVTDFEGPNSDESFRELAYGIASSLRDGEGVLIHCGAGIGRTGMVAIAVLMVMGVPRAEAERRVRAAGSRPERLPQEAALRRLEEFLVSSH